MKKTLCIVLTLVLLFSAVAMAEETILIGGIAPLTGEAMVYGELVRDGVNLAVKQYNANGGLLGKQIEIQWLDDAHDATKAVLAYGDLLSAGMVALIGPVTTTPTVAVATRSVEDNMPMITASATAYEVTDPGNNIFRACFLDPFQGKLMAQYASESLGAQKVAVIYDNSNPYSIGLAEAFQAQAEALGMEIVDVEVATADNNDFTPQLIKIADAEPDALFIPYYYEAVAMIMRNAMDVGLECVTLGGDGWAGVAEQLADAPELLDNSYYCDSFSSASESEVCQNFITDFTAEYGVAPIGFNALGYDAAMIMFNAIQNAGSTDSDAIIAQLDATDMECVTGSIVFDDHNDPIKSAFVMGFENGVPTLETIFQP